MAIGILPNPIHSANIGGVTVTTDVIHAESQPSYTKPNTNPNPSRTTWQFGTTVLVQVTSWPMPMSICQCVALYSALPANSLMR